MQGHALRCKEYHSSRSLAGGGGGGGGRRSNGVGADFAALVQEESGAFPASTKSVEHISTYSPNRVWSMGFSRNKGLVKVSQVKNVVLAGNYILRRMVIGEN